MIKIEEKLKDENELEQSFYSGSWKKIILHIELIDFFERVIGIELNKLLSIFFELQLSCSVFLKNTKIPDIINNCFRMFQIFFFFQFEFKFHYWEIPIRNS